MPLTIVNISGDTNAIAENEDMMADCAFLFFFTMAAGLKPSILYSVLNCGS